MLARNYWSSKFIDRLLTTTSSNNGMATMTTDNVIVSKPAVLNGTWHQATTDKNTAVRVTGVEGGIYTGTNYILYDRVGFEAYVNIKGDGYKTKPMQIPAITKKSQLVPFLNIYFGLGLSADEIIEGDVTIPSAGGVFTIRIDPTANNYQFNAGYDFPCTTDGYVASATVKKADLSGLVYPSTDLTASQAYMASYPLSFTKEFATLSKLTVQSQVDAALMKSINNVMGTKFTMEAGDYSLSGAKIIYAALNSTAVQANPNYKYVVTIKLSNDSVKMRGTLILQYNEPFDVTLPPADGEAIPG